MTKRIHENSTKILRPGEYPSGLCTLLILNLPASIFAAMPDKKDKADAHANGNPIERMGLFAEPVFITTNDPFDPRKNGTASPRCRSGGFPLGRAQRQRQPSVSFYSEPSAR
jgi:hypothetical protein